MSENWGQTELSEREIGGAGPVPLGGEVSHNVAPGAETFEIIKSEGAQYIVLRGEAGTHRVRAGKLDARAFDAAADVSPAADTIVMTSHGYATGDGPLFLSGATAAMTGDPDLTFADADPDTITRAAGSWITDGFEAGMLITVDSASNDGTFTIASLTATVITLIGSDTLVAEGPTGGHTVTGAAVLPAGLAAGTPFWLVVIDDDTIQLTANPGNANRIKQTGVGSLEESDAIVVDITADGGATVSLGGFQGTGVAVGFTPADPPAADLADGGSIPLIANEVVIFHGRAITVRATAAADILTWWEI